MSQPDQPAGEMDPKALAAVADRAFQEGYVETWLTAAKQIGREITPEEIRTAWKNALEQNWPGGMVEAVQELKDAALAEETLTYLFEHFKDESLGDAQACLEVIGREFTNEEIDRLLLITVKQYQADSGPLAKVQAIWKARQQAKPEIE